MKNPTSTIEVVMYTLKPDQAQNRALIIEEVNQIVSKLSGFISRKVYQSPTDETLYMDYVAWESLEAAQQAAIEIQKIPEIQPFMEAITEVKIMDHFVQQ